MWAIEKMGPKLYQAFMGHIWVDFESPGGNIKTNKGLGVADRK